jgi:hypothetical protein
MAASFAFLHVPSVPWKSICCNLVLIIKCYAHRIQHYCCGEFSLHFFLGLHGFPPFIDTLSLNHFVIRNIGHFHAVHK